MTKYYPFGAKTYTLASSIGSTDTSFTLQSFVEPVTGTPYTMSLLNTDIVFGTFGPKTAASEFISFTGITQNSDGTATITGVTRGLARKYPFTTDSTYKQPHSGQSLFIISDAPQVFQKYISIDNDNDINGKNTFEQVPSSNADPINPTDLTRMSWVQALVLGTLTTIDIIIPGTAGATVAKGQYIYLDTATDTWKLTDATASAKSQNVLIGIAQSAATSGNAFASGILIQGLDANQTGLSAGTVYYLSNTPGAVGSSAGTYSVVVGIAKDSTHMYFVPGFNQQVTQDQLNALVGTVGTPSSSNKYVTDADTTATPTANRVVRFNSGGSLPGLLDTFTYGETITIGQPLYFNTSDSKVYKASASAVGDALSGYIGIAAESGVVNDVKTVITKKNSVVTGLSLGAATTSISSTAAVSQSDGGTVGGISFYTGQPCGWGFLSASDQDNIEKIDVKFGANVGVGAGQATLDIYEVTSYNSGSSISLGASLGSVTVVSPTASAINTFTFSSPITIKPNTHYAIKMTASGGSGANYFTIDTNSGTISSNYFSNGNGATMTTITRIAGLVAKHTVYSTSTRNYYVGDYIFLGDTAGTFSFQGGTYKFPIGKILSSTSIILGIPDTRTFISSAQPNYISGDQKWLNIPIPKNTLVTDFQWSWTITTPTTFNVAETIRIGEVGTKTQAFKDGTGASEADISLSCTFGRAGAATIAGNNIPGTFQSTTSTIYFAK